MDTPSPLDPLDPNVPLRKLSADAQGSEKPLPPPPSTFERALSEAPVLNTPISATEHASRPSLSSAPSFQRPKKRIVWKNRGIIIGLPIDNEFGRKTTRESYLTPEDVAQRLGDWKSKGYDIKGFVLAPASADTPPFLDGQSRAVHPDPEDEKRERADRTYKVSIPNRQDWEMYVDQLKEEKLRALGVSFGDEELPRKSPAPSLLSRQASSQSSAMLISPTLAPSSAQATPFPPNFQGPVNPAAQMGKPGVSHFPRYSMALPFSEKPFGSSNQFPPNPQSPLPGTWSPQQLIEQYMASPPGSRVASPLANAGLMQDINMARSPVPPPIQNNVPPQAQNIIGKISAAQASFLRQQQALQKVQQLQTQQLQSQQLQPQHQQQQQQQQHKLQPHLLPVTGNAQNQGRKLQAPLSGAQPEIASPIPRGHRQNPSETLQKEVDENESYLQRTSSHVESHQDSTDENNDSMHVNDAALGNNVVNGPPNIKVDVSDLETNPSLAGTPDHHKRTAVPSQNGHLPKLSTSSKVSASKLNVNAPEFKLEPRKAFEPGDFAYLGSPQRPIPPVSQVASAATNLGHSRKQSSGPTKFNVAAPVFTPGAARKVTIPSGEFSFSTSGPSFRPDAPAFKPGDTGPASGNESSGKENPIDAVKKIFGEIKFHEVIKPPKKSKAVPIVKPDNSLGLLGQTAPELDGQEDESGRITQADGRQKRVRREIDDGDQVPLFASPNQTPWMDNGYDDRAAYFSRTPSPKPDANIVDAATELLEELIDDMSATEVSDLMREDESVDTDARPFEPHTFHDIGEAESFNAARPPGGPLETSTNRHEITPDDVAKATKDFLDKSPQYQAAFDEALQDGASRSRSRNLSREDEKRPSSDTQREDEVDRLDHARQDIMDGVRYVEPSYHEIDAIMKHLNRDDSDLGVERRPSPFRRRASSISPKRSPAPILENISAPPDLLAPATIRSDAPSPSPNRLRGNFQYLPPTDTESANTSVVDMVSRNARHSPSYRPSGISPPVHRLNSPGSTPPSDWDDAISSVDEVKFRSRTGFFDNRVNDIVGGIVQQRLNPLEKTLSGIQESLAKLSGRSTSRRPRSSGKVDVEHSDADDEEDTDDLRTSSRMKSPLRDRKYDQLKSTLNEITAAQQNLVPASQLTEIMNALKDLKSSNQPSPASITTPEEIKAIIEEAVGKSRGRSGPVKESSQAAIIEKNQLQIAGLESMLKAADSRADDEMKARRSTEDALADNQRLLRQAMQEAAQQRESAEATERSLQEYHEERHQALQRTAMLEGSRESLEKNISDLSAKNTALEGTLAEYRLSSDQWRSEIDDARHENKDLRRTIDCLKAELEENVQARQAFRSKFERLQEDMTRVSQEMTMDQSRWLGKEEEHNARLEMLSARLEAEARTRERLELEIERLEAQEKEAMKARFMVEQTQKANSQLEVMVAGLRTECHEHQKTAARFERELHDAREAGRTEVERMRKAMEVDIEAANSQVNIVRAGLESVVARLHKQIESITVDANSARARHELMLEEAAESRNRALQEAADAREAALQEHYRFHERMIGELKAQHERELQFAFEDKQRSDTHFGNRLSLADEKAVHYQDKIVHLEEKLEIAKSAAHAAVQAAQSKKAAASPATTRSQPFGSVSSIPEKISPQALRESIMVLQEQLQERESRIEQLESELSAVDVAAPAKLKDAEVEINWLRELLGVRIDDLEDIITTLSQPAYNREAVKDAAIRLKANLQMEQQEKERALAGGQTFPSLTSISNLAASPRALPLAAAAAWGNWRKGKEQGFGNLNAIANGNAHQHQTPSKSSPQSFFAGLMTPPSTDMRSTPLAVSENRRPISSSSRQRAVAVPTTPRQSISGGSDGNGLIKPEPVTPPLMRKASYDLDATESASFSELGDEGVGESHIGGDDEPFGPKLGGIVGEI